MERDGRLRDSFFERVKIHDDQINRLDAMLGGGRFVLGIAANEQQTAVNFGVQRFHAAVQHFREAGKLADFDDRDARRLDRARRAAGGNNLDAELMELADELDQPCLIGNTDERAPNFTHAGAQPTGETNRIQRISRR